MESMKKQVEFFKDEVQQRHLQNMVRIQQMDELLGTFAPGLVSSPCFILLLSLFTFLLLPLLLFLFFVLFFCLFVVVFFFWLFII